MLGAKAALLLSAVSLWILEIDQRSDRSIRRIIYPVDLWKGEPFLMRSPQVSPPKPVENRLKALCVECAKLGPPPSRRYPLEAHRPARTIYTTLFTPVDTAQVIGRYRRSDLFPPGISPPRADLDLYSVPAWGTRGAAPRRDLLAISERYTPDVRPPRETRPRPLPGLHTALSLRPLRAQQSTKPRAYPQTDLRLCISLSAASLGAIRGDLARCSLLLQALRRRPRSASAGRVSANAGAEPSPHLRTARSNVACVAGKARVIPREGRAVRRSTAERQRADPAGWRVVCRGRLVAAGGGPCTEGDAKQRRRSARGGSVSVLAGGSGSANRPRVLVGGRSVRGARSWSLR